MIEATVPVRVEILIRAARDKVFDGLTSMRALESWFCEHADVDLAAKRYDFWGRFTPEVPDRIAGRHELVTYDESRLFSYEWNVHGQLTRVAFILEPQGNDTLVAVEQRVPPNRVSVGSLSDFWALSLENLRSWLERGKVGIRCDFSEAKKEPVTESVDIEVPPEDVYRALIEPSQLERYLATKATVEPKVGGKYDLGWGMGPIKILDIEPNEKLSYSWHVPHGPHRPHGPHGDDEPETVVTWSLEGSGGRTRLTIVHSGFAADRKMEDYRLGWLKYLNDIKSMLEVGEAWRSSVTRDDDCTVV